MKRIKLIGKTLPKIKLPDPNVRRIISDEFGHAMGAVAAESPLAVEPRIQRIAATTVECPTCGAWIGWACEGAEYGYHAAGYHPSRERAAEHAAMSKTIDFVKETP